MCSKFILTGVNTSGRRKRCNGHSVFGMRPKVSVLPGYRTGSVLTKVYVRAKQLFPYTSICSHCYFTSIAIEGNSSSHEACCKSRIALLVLLSFS